MEYQFNIELNKQYYSECYDERNKYGNKWKNINYYFAFIFIVVGSSILIYSNKFAVTPIALIIFGFFELFSPYIKRSIWLRRQMSNKTANTEVEITITEKELLTKGKYSEGNMAWEGMDKILDTPKGIVIWPQKGIVIYIPKTKLNVEAITYVLSKIF